MRTRFFIFNIILMVFGLSIFGCSRGVPKDFPALHPCVITVTQDGTPLAEASVLLKPIQGNALSASGVTDKNGIAVMKVQATFDGAPEGKYKVMIVKQTREKNPEVKAEELQEFAPDSTALREKEYIITDFVDPKFGNATQTPLEIQIQSGKNESTFEVTKPNK